jgi:hypothetical protein
MRPKRPLGAKRRKPDHDKLLNDLFTRFAPNVSEHVWPHEIGGWYELVFCIVQAIGEPKILPATVRHVTNTMAELGLLDVTLLAKLSDGKGAASEPHLVTLRTMLEHIGCSPDEAERAVLAVCRAAAALKRSYDGKVQNYFRRYGEEMLERIGEDLGLAELKEGRRAAATWLQNALGMPLPVSTPLIEQACRKLGVSYAELSDAVNQHDINVALLDDALRTYLDRSATAPTTAA